MKQKNTYSTEGNIVDLRAETIFKGRIFVENGIIVKVEKDESIIGDQYILPGLIDAHIHIESSMLIPSEFARLASVHGTVATVSDPHEIANVLGIEGINYMINNGNKVPFKFYFGASSCVPATPFETAGFELGLNELDQLLARDEIKYMSEMMNFPGVIHRDEFVMKKLDIAKKYDKPIDGHAPGVVGEDARKYIDAGITTDHECFTMEEALSKISYGMKIQIREGSAAKNFDALVGLLEDHADDVLFCSDDKHPDDLVEGHINRLVIRAIKKGFDPIKVLKSAIINPIEHYKLDVGTLQVGDPADMIMVDNLTDFNVVETYADGILIAKNGKTLIDSVNESAPNNFQALPLKESDMVVKPESNCLRVMEALDGQLITTEECVSPKVVNGNVVSDPERDILKIVVLNRYKKAAPAIAFIRNFNLKEGAIASSVAHDSHNIVAVGVDDADIAKAINLVIKEKGGVSLVSSSKEMILPLPVAGLMSAEDGYLVAEKYHEIDHAAHALGSTLRAPFMTLSFMALLVIPNLKLSDKGLFDGTSFSFTDLFA
ncbi:MAG: adenine deaminase [Marinilabiliales bacterium]|jgi:adenine deaminase|nr:MAG: adenine deaminase [Marinilabiliales bacterium]